MAIRGRFDVGRARDRSAATLGRWVEDVVENPGAHLALLFTSLFLITPIALAFLLSAQSGTQAGTLDRLIPDGVGALYGNYYDVIVEDKFWRLALNTTLVAGTTTVGGIVLSLTAAMAIVFYDFRGKQVAFLFVLLTLMVPFVIRVVPLYELIVDLGWHNTYLGVTVPFLANATGVFLYRQQFKAIPVDLVEHCRLDGVGPVAFLWNVLLPMTKGMTAGLSVILFVTTWNVYLWPLIAINDIEKQMIQVGLQHYYGGMAAAIVTLTPPLVLVLAVRKNLLDTMSVQ